MSDNNNSGDKTLHMSQTKTLSLKRPIEQGMVRQSFSHGRTKAVVVEKVKRRIIGPGETRPEAPVVEAAPVAPAPVEPVCSSSMLWAWRKPRLFTMPRMIRVIR